MEMKELEKVIKGLEYHLKELSVGKTCFECPYCGDNPCEIQLISNTLALLKEQEAKPMTEYDDGWDCPRCGLKLVGKTKSGYPCDEFDLPNDEIVKYCPVCGQAVKWNE